MEEEEDPALKAATKVVMGTGADIVGGAAGVVVKTGTNMVDLVVEKTGIVVDKVGDGADFVFENTAPS
jgi:hypothetical protein